MIFLVYYIFTQCRKQYIWCKKKCQKIYNRLKLYRPLKKQNKKHINIVSSFHIYIYILTNSEKILIKDFWFIKLTVFV